jgi:acyl dehydratase
MFRPGDAFIHEFRVDRAVYDAFVKAFGDHNPLHVDDAFAASKGFQGKVMHGNILGGFLSYFVGECLPTKEVVLHSQRIDYKRPVYLDDVLTFEASVEEVHESVGAVEFRFQFRKSGAEVVAKGRLQIGLLK